MCRTISLNLGVFNRIWDVGQPCILLSLIMTFHFLISGDVSISFCNFWALACPFTKVCNHLHKCTCIYFLQFLHPLQFFTLSNSLMTVSINKSQNFYLHKYEVYLVLKLKTSAIDLSLLKSDLEMFFEITPCPNPFL